MEGLSVGPSAATYRPLEEALRNRMSNIVSHAATYCMRFETTRLIIWIEKGANFVLALCHKCALMKVVAGG